MFQLLFTTRFLRRFGIGTALFMLPATVLMGSVGLVAFGTLAAVTTLKSCDQVLRYSLDQSTRELLYLPLAARVKIQVKWFLDTVVWRLGDGLSGLAVLVCATLLHMPARQISWVVLVLVSVWTPLMSEQISRRWFSWPNILLLSPVPIATALVAFGTWRALSGTSQFGAFIGAIGLFALSYAGIAISLWPMIVPHHYTLWQAASSPSTQAFLMVGTLFLLPVILVYTGWSYWVFRGKVRADVGYH